MAEKTRLELLLEGKDAGASAILGKVSRQLDTLKNKSSVPLVNTDGLSKSSTQVKKLNTNLSRTVGLGSDIRAAFNFSIADRFLRGLSEFSSKVTSLSRESKVLEEALGDTFEKPSDIIESSKDIVDRYGGSLLEIEKIFLKTGSASDVFQENTELLSSTIESASAVSRQFNLSGEQTSLVFKGLTDVANKNVASMEEVKRQLGDQIPIWKILSQGAGKSISEITSAIESGSVSAEEFFTIFDRGAREVFPSAFKFYKDAATEQKRLNTAFEEFLIIMGDNAEGGIQVFNRNLREAIKSSPELAKGLGSVIDIAGRIGSSIVGLGKIIKGVIQGVAAGWSVFESAAVTAIGSTVSKATALLAKIEPLQSVIDFESITKEIEDFTSFSSTVLDEFARNSKEGAFEDINEGIEIIKNSFSGAAEDIEASTRKTADAVEGNSLRIEKSFDGIGRILNEVKSEINDDPISLKVDTSDIERVREEIKSLSEERDRISKSPIVTEEDLARAQEASGRIFELVQKLEELRTQKELNDASGSQEFISRESIDAALDGIKELVESSEEARAKISSLDESQRNLLSALIRNLQLMAENGGATRASFEDIKVSIDNLLNSGAGTGEGSSITKLIEEIGSKARASGVELDNLKKKTDDISAGQISIEASEGASEGFSEKLSNITKQQDLMSQSGLQLKTTQEGLVLSTKMLSDETASLSESISTPNGPAVQQDMAVIGQAHQEAAIKISASAGASEEFRNRLNSLRDTSAALPQPLADASTAAQESASQFEEAASSGGIQSVTERMLEAQKAAQGVEEGARGSGSEIQTLAENSKAGSESLGELGESSSVASEELKTAGKDISKASDDISKSIDRIDFGKFEPLSISLQDIVISFFQLQKVSDTVSGTSFPELISSFSELEDGVVKVETRVDSSTKALGEYNNELSKVFETAIASIDKAEAKIGQLVERVQEALENIRRLKEEGEAL